MNDDGSLPLKFTEEDRLAVFTFNDTINEAVSEFVETSSEESTKIIVLINDAYNNV